MGGICGPVPSPALFSTALMPKQLSHGVWMRLEGTLSRPWTARTAAHQRLKLRVQRGVLMFQISGTFFELLHC